MPTGNLYYYMANGSSREDDNWLNDTGKTFTISGGSSIFFPASGLRDFGDGSLINVGSLGCNWAASASGSYTSHARRLYFYSGGWYWGSSSRANGYSVRAVAEE